MEKEFITDHKVKFEKETGFKFHFPFGCLVTPIWKRGYIVRVLVSDKGNGRAFYVDTKTKNMVIDKSCFIRHLPQGITYITCGTTTLLLLNTWIRIY